MSGHRTARLALGSVVAAVVSASACVPSAVCTSDADCAAFGAGSVCVRGERAEGLCTDGDLTPDDVNPPRLDAGPPGDDAGPGELTISLEVRPSATVAKSETVTLQWEAPAAVSCSVRAQALPDPASHDVAGASTDASGSANLSVTQDTTVTVTCEDADGLSESRSELVDVTTEADLRATHTSVNAGANVELEWDIYGARECTLVDDDGAVLQAIAPAEFEGGAATHPATTPRFALSCDGVEVGAVDLTLASLSGLEADPPALGPTPEVVTLSWVHDGPGSCRVFLDEATTATPDDSADPGFQVRLEDTTDVTVRCDGHGGELTLGLEVPRLIDTFTGPPAPVAHGAEVTLTYDAVAGATCTIYDAAGDVVANPIPAVGASARYDLVCSVGDLSAEASVDVLVLPAAPEVRGELLPTEPGAVLSLVVETSPNALSCELLPSSGAPLPLTPGASDEDRQVFTAELAANSGSGSVTYGARCFSDAARALSALTEGDDGVHAYFGDLDPDTLGNVGDATLLLGDVTLFNDGSVTTNDLTVLAGVRQMAGALFVQGLDHDDFDSLDPLRLERVVGDITVKQNPYLGRLGVDAVAGPTGDRGFAWLVEVHGDVLIEGNVGLTSAPFPRLLTLNGGLEVNDNGSLSTLSAPALAEIGSLLITNNPGLGGGGGFAALERVAGALTVSQTSIAALRDYFPLLTEVVGAFTVTLNDDMTCDSIEAVLCKLPEGQPGALVVSSNHDNCGVSEAPSTCSAP